MKSSRIGPGGFHLSGPSHELWIEDATEIPFLIQILRMAGRKASNRPLEKRKPVSFPMAGLHALRDGLKLIELEASRRGGTR